MPRLVKPRAIARGATIGIAAPCGPVDPAIVEAGCAVWRAAGFRVKHRRDLTARLGYLAGDDGRRRSELETLLADPEVAAIVCARGGYGCARILPSLDPARVRAARKPIVGYSDVTALLLWQVRCAGLVGLHGPMLERGHDVDPAASAAVVAELTGETQRPLVLSGTGRLPGRAEGRLTGGNLVMVTASLATPWEIDTRGAILLIEEVGERPYRIDRMLQQLRAAGKLEELAGIGVGDVASCVDERYPAPDALGVIEAGARTAGVPLVVGLPFGHVKPNRAWPLGVRATIDGERGEVTILERGVTRTQ